MLRRRLRTRPAADRGFALVLMALVLVSMLGIAGLVVDLGAWQVEASRIQQAADAASLAGVVRLPDGDDAAITRAREIAADNGFDDSDADVTVTVTPLGDETLEVAITKANVDQYFTQIFRDPTTITRRSTAQYVQPVPLGSPRNYLGTSDLSSIGVAGDGVENFFLAVSGHCSRKEYGDRITPLKMDNPEPDDGHSCALHKDNPEYDDDGYLFGVRVPEGSGPVLLQMFDAPVCTDPVGGDVFGEQAAAFDVEVTVRRNDDLDPLLGTTLTNPPLTFDGENSTTGQCRFGTPNAQDECADADHLRECWTTLYTLPGEGEYSVQVDPMFSGDASRNERHNVFALRAKTGSIGDPFIACTSDEARAPEGPSATPPYSLTCPQVFGFEHVPIYAQGTASPLFFLASIDSRHNGKTLQVTLFDAAEGAETITLVDPDGNDATVTWEILCTTGASAGGSPCPGENEPLGGRSGGPTTAVNVAGTVGEAHRTFDRNHQSGKYSDRLLRLSLELPADIDAAYGGETWWKIRYSPPPGDDFDGDRTTWSVKLLGDPVRLLPNAPTTTTP